MSNTDTATLDKVAGIVIIASSACGVCVGAGVLGFGGVAGIAGIGGAVGGRDYGVPATVIGGAAVLIGLMLVVACGLKVAGGIGILQSKRWGFIVSAIVCGFAALASFGNNSHGVAVLDLALCIYAILRLAGQIGTAP